MRTIEESIAVLERWRTHGTMRTFVILSAESNVNGIMRQYTPPSVSWCGDNFPTGRSAGNTIQDALDKAASEVEK